MKRASRVSTSMTARLVFVGVKIDVLALAHQAMEQGSELGQPLDARDAGDLLRLLLGKLVALPGREQLVGLAHKEDFPQLVVVRVRVKQEDSLLLFNAGEVEEVGVLAQGQRAIGAGVQAVVGIDQGQRVGEEQLGEVCPVIAEQLWIDWVITHKGHQTLVAYISAVRDDGKLQLIAEPAASRLQTPTACPDLTMVPGTG